jgi:small-conductance mechanosensitive channel
MQNIVNNFVSGIILLFEKPFQIGDFIELADKKGKIQDIGIRSSKMLTQQGGQVIIPNADLIANRFVNWTINSVYIKSEMTLKINIAADMNKVTQIIREEFTKSADAVKGSKPEVVINSLSADTAELKMMIWISSIYMWNRNLKAGYLTDLSTVLQPNRSRSCRPVIHRYWYQG